MDGWGGTGEGAAPHFRLPTQPKVGEGGAGAARNKTANASGARGGGDAAGDAGQDPDADKDEEKKGIPKMAQRKKTGNTGKHGEATQKAKPKTKKKKKKKTQG